MSREKKALQDIWYGRRTTEDYQTLEQALDILDFIRNCQIVKLNKPDNTGVLVVLPLTFYVDAKRYNQLKDFFEK